VNVLGVHAGHDAGASIVTDGRIVADVAEERFSRVKHDAGLPVSAIASCLELARLELADIDAVAVPTESELPGLNDLFDLYEGPHEQGSGMLRAAATSRRLPMPALPRRPVYARRYPLPRHTELVKVHHHLAHAASAYYTSGYDGRQLIVTLDGIGDGFSGAVWRGEGGRIEPLERFGRAGSLGWFYGNVTEALGWAHGDGEGTVMGLAAYGDTDRVHGALAAFHPQFEHGALVRPHEFTPIHPWNEHGAYQWHSSEAATIAQLIPRFGRERLAAEAQRVLEEQVGQIIYPWLEREDTRALACSGGVFLNVKVNQRIWQSRKVERQHIYPNPGDGGLAAGAALHVYHDAHPGAPIVSLEHLYLGPRYSDEDTARLICDRRLEATRRDDVVEFAARQLAENRIVAWFQGRMESGPRALGNRSILMNPRRAENKDLLNARVKFREAFRPFCPSVAAECADAYLQQARPEPFMITSFDVCEDKRNVVPAVVHVDGTIRPQTVDRHANPRYWELIDAFGKLTGERTVLNTSFNVKGEPIVCSPRDAIRAFYDTGLDCLIIGNYVLTKPGAA
jgi:carbamoyltransferase